MVPYPNRCGTLNGAAGSQTQMGSRPHFLQAFIRLKVTLLKLNLPLGADCEGPSLRGSQTQEGKRGHNFAA